MTRCRSQGGWFLWEAAPTEVDTITTPTQWFEAVTELSQWTSTSLDALQPLRHCSMDSSSFRRKSTGARIFYTGGTSDQNPPYQCQSEFSLSADCYQKLGSNKTWTFQCNVYGGDAMWKSALLSLFVETWINIKILLSDSFLLYLPVYQLRFIWFLLNYSHVCV